MTTSESDHSKRILVVDDEVAIAETLQVLLSEDGIEVSIAYNGSEALEMVREERPASTVADGHPASCFTGGQLPPSASGNCDWDRARGERLRSGADRLGNLQNDGRVLLDERLFVVIGARGPEHPSDAYVLAGGSVHPVVHLPRLVAEVQ